VVTGDLYGQVDAEARLRGALMPVRASGAGAEAGYRKPRDGWSRWRPRSAPS